MSIGEFLTLTPKTYRERTGKKLGWFKKRALVKAQDKVRTRMGRNKQADSGFSKGAYVVLTIFGLVFIAMGVIDDWEGSNWIIALVLFFLFWLPAVIYGFVLMNDYV